MQVAMALAVASFSWEQATTRTPNPFRLILVLPPPKYAILVPSNPAAAASDVRNPSAINPSRRGRANCPSTAGGPGAAADIA